MTTVISADGTAIAFERTGEGPPVVLVAAALCDRLATRPLAAELGRHFTVFGYDRRGRGESGDTAPDTVRQEIDDLGAIIAEAGGEAAVYGHSSGAVLALHAAASGLLITALILHEPPFLLQDDPAERERSQAQLQTIEELLAQDRPADAIAAFLTPAGMPQQLIDSMSRDPGTQANARTLPIDPFAMLSEESRGGRTPIEQARDVTVPALVLCGGASHPWMIETGRRIAEAMPNGTHRVLPDQGHIVPAEVLAPALTDYLSTP
ncbi:alpha/beta hydrolase [Actinomadura sp. KC216]|uniref:alpha/beta fold hydrolase n=1 Tax=Actinomadura sp. KC216 TaxID=2530370 RepID=UPI00104EA75B|nr:alpha/beta hydrolase [Actinomadura sp. KC216]TDB88278.1 alpha/beta hydrolase [Actinomadura sp. KC216]